MVKSLNSDEKSGIAHVGDSAFKLYRKGCCLHLQFGFYQVRYISGFIGIQDDT